MMQRKAFILGALVVLSVVFSILVVQSALFSRVLGGVRQKQLEKRLAAEVQLGGVTVQLMRRRLIQREFSLSKKNTEFKRFSFAR